MPANAGLFFRSIMQVAAFDFYDITDIVHNSFSLEPTEPIDQNFESIGFESLYFLINLGTMAFFFIVYFFALLLTLLVGLFASKSNKRVYSCHKAMKGKLFWGSLITLMLESY